MFSSLNPKNKILFVILVVLLVAGIVTFVVLRTPASQQQTIVIQPSQGADYQKESDQISIAVIASTTQQVTLKGVSVCLPHRDTSGPTTMECAIGIKTVDGNYYALDTAGGAYKDLPTNIAVVVKGEFTPIEMISSNIGKIYNIKGIIRSTSTEVAPKE